MRRLVVTDGFTAKWTTVVGVRIMTITCAGVRARCNMTRNKGVTDWRAFRFTLERAAWRPRVPAIKRTFFGTNNYKLKKKSYLCRKQTNITMGFFGRDKQSWDIEKLDRKVYRHRYILHCWGKHIFVLFHRVDILTGI